MKKEEVYHQISMTERFWVLAFVEEDELNVYELNNKNAAEDFNVDHSTNVRRLKKRRKVCKLVECVPLLLYDNNKAESVRIFTDLLQRNDQIS